MSDLRTRVAVVAVLVLALVGLAQLPAVAAPPVVADDTLTFHKNAPDFVFLSDYASDDDGDTLTYEIFPGIEPVHGDLTNCSSGSCTYTPDNNYVGLDSFGWRAKDANGYSNLAIMTIDVQEGGHPQVNHLKIVSADNNGATLTWGNPPGAGTAVVRRSDSFPAPQTVNEGTGMTVVGGNTATATGLTLGHTYFFSVFWVTGSAPYTPITDSFTISSNQPPVANDDNANVVRNTAKSIQVLGNDNDPNNDTLTITGKTNGAHGTVTCSTPSCTYTPATNYVGPDTFTYTISDGNGGTDTATVTVTVALPPNGAPVAVADTITTAEDTASVAKNVVANDTDDGGTANLNIIPPVCPPENNGVGCPTQDGAHGTVVCQTKSCVYTPEPNFNGQDSFVYSISDGQGGTASAVVTVTVTAVNDLPVAATDVASTNEDTPVQVAVLANDTDVDGNPLTVVGKTNGTKGGVTCTTTACTYTPNLNTNGADTFTYTVSDGTGTRTGTVNITVTPVNDAPNAVDDTLSTTKNTASAPKAVLANDTDVDGNTLTVVGKTNGANGTVTCTTTTCTYTPAGDYVGTDTFTYTISDGTVQDTATVNVTVTPPSFSDVGVTLTRQAAVSAAGNSNGWTFVVANAGNTTSPAVTLSDVLPTGFKLQNVTTSNLAPCSGTSTVTCSLGGIAPGGNVTVVVRGAFTKIGSLPNTVTITAAGDPTPANNTDTETTTISGKSCTIVGTFGNDTLVGNSAANVICGLAGNDVLKSLQGNDTLYGNEGNDHVNGYTGADLLDGGPGIDTADFNSLTAGVTVDLTAGTASGQGADKLVSVENATGSNGPDVLVGNSLTNLLNGLAGNDSLSGLDGNDRLLGGNGNDRLIGGNGNDTLDGGTGTDNCAQGPGTGSKISC